MDVGTRLAEAVGSDQVLTGEEIPPDYTHDESLTVAAQPPAYLVRPATTGEVADLLRIAAEHGVPVTARGAGTGMSGACVPEPDGLVVSFERMNRILELDTANHVAVVQPGLTLVELDAATAAAGLVYPVFPGEGGASLGGNVATNAGGMRAVRYGVTRRHVLGVEAVTGTGAVIRTGGKYVKSATGYDLTQLVVGSEGTLALVTEAVLALAPRPAHAATVLAPFTTLTEVTQAVPDVVGSGLAPVICEYIDLLTMAAITGDNDLELGIGDDVRERALAYLVISLENRSADRLEEDVQALGERLAALGAIDVYVLPSGAARRLVEAREKAFWTAKAAGADDIVDIVVPRAAMADFLDRAGKIAASGEAFIAGCGHAGDGNVHLAVFQPDAETRHRALHALFSAAAELGGAISGEHGIGLAKKPYLLEFTDPVQLELMRQIKRAFDPAGILNPGTIFD